MGTLYARPYGFQIRITNKLLPKDLWATLDTRDAAEQYMQQQFAARWTLPTIPPAPDFGPGRRVRV